MKTRLLAFALTLFTIGAISCTKSDDTKPVQVSYLVDGHKRTGTGTATFHTGEPYFYDVLNIHIVSEVSSTQQERVELSYLKGRGEPDSFYSPSECYLDGTQYFPTSPRTAAKTSTGSWSGTFSGSTNATGHPASAITNGVFTDVHE